MFVGYKLIFKTKKHRAEDIDLFSGKREIDEDEAEYEADNNAGPRQNFFLRWWNS